MATCSKMLMKCLIMSDGASNLTQHPHQRRSDGETVLRWVPGETAAECEVHYGRLRRINVFKKLLRKDRWTEADTVSDNEKHNCLIFDYASSY